MQNEHERVSDTFNFSKGLTWRRGNVISCERARSVINANVKDGVLRVHERMMRENLYK